MRPVCILFFLSVQNVLFTFVRASTLIAEQFELCGPETELQLTPNGETSSATVSLPSALGDHKSPCKLHVNAPKTHVIYMQFAEGPLMKNKIPINESHHPPCVMHIILPDSSAPFWKGDLCSSKPLAPVDLLPSDFKIIWNRPSSTAFIHSARKLVLTAVGQGIVCKDPEQHTCMRIGRVPLLCVSNHLLCDGVYNCPRSSTKSDEDASVCDKNPLSQTTWGQIAMEMIKKWKLTSPQDDQKIIANKNKIIITFQDFQKRLETSTPSIVVEKETKTADSISQMLAKYGPWGYLMLGLLICGTVLMFCGLWECCFKRQKDPIEQSGLQTQPTAVLIINQSGNEETPGTPPNYDELEPPPSYSALFPNAKASCSSSDEAAPNASNSGDNDRDTGQMSISV